MDGPVYVFPQKQARSLSSSGKYSSTQRLMRGLYGWHVFFLMHPETHIALRSITRSHRARQLSEDDEDFDPPDLDEILGISGGHGAAGVSTHGIGAPHLPPLWIEGIAKRSGMGGMLGTIPIMGGIGGIGTPSPTVGINFGGSMGKPGLTSSPPFPGTFRMSVMPT
jgi:hypothetical protein